jgi:hypothetical protein
MSCKPYIFRLRTDDDVTRLGKFILKMNSDPPNAWINFFYRVDKDYTPQCWQRERPALKRGDVLAAVTADVGPMWLALTETGAYDQQSPSPAFWDAEDLPRVTTTKPGEGVLLKNMTILGIEPNRIWKSRVKSHLRRQEQDHKDSTKLELSFTVKQISYLTDTRYRSFVEEQPGRFRSHEASPDDNVERMGSGWLYWMDKDSYLHALIVQQFCLTRGYHASILADERDSEWVVWTDDPLDRGTEKTS